MLGDFKAVYVVFFWYDAARLITRGSQRGTA